jgi:hypothetical protein
MRFPVIQPDDFKITFPNAPFYSGAPDAIPPFGYYFYLAITTIPRNLYPGNVSKPLMAARPGSAILLFLCMRAVI